MSESSASVLFIDPNKELFLRTRNFLSEVNPQYELEWAGSFSAGKNAIEHHKHDVCLIDYDLDKQHDFNLLRELKDQGVGTQAVLLTNEDIIPDDQRVAENTRVDFLLKERLCTTALCEKIDYAIKLSAKEIRHQRELQKLFRAEKMDAIRTLSGGIAHNLNNALTVVMGHLDLINFYSKTSPKIQKSLGAARLACQRSMDLIEQIELFSKQSKISPHQIVVSEIINEVLKKHWPEIPANIRFKFQFLPGLTIEGDMELLRESFYALLANAMNSLPDGGTISIQSSNEFVRCPHLHTPNALPGTYVVIRISDSGSGLHPPELSKIFNPFYSTESLGVEEGLGLYIVYGTMEAVGGWVELDSTVGEGTTFSLYFPTPLRKAGLSLSPAERAEEMRQTHRAPLLKKDSSEGTILLIDDEESLLDIGAEFLKRAGYNVATFFDPVAALDWYCEHYGEVKLVVLDMKMPKKAGVQCFREIRRINSSASIVICSGCYDSEAEEVLQAGAMEFFRKPMVYPELLAWISLHISRDPP